MVHCQLATLQMGIWTDRIGIRQGLQRLLEPVLHTAQPNVLPSPMLPITSARTQFRSLRLARL